MLDREDRPIRNLKYWIAILTLGAVLFGTMGGAIVGGLAGYTVAQKSVSSAPVVLSSAPTYPAVTPEVVLANASSPLSEAQLAELATENESLIASVETVKSATVTVINITNGNLSSGSGVLIDEAGYLVTNNHVIEDADRLEIILDHGGRVSAQLVGATADFDLAVLKIDSVHVPATAALGDSSALRLGERVAAIGSALGGFRNTVTSGVVSAHNRSLGGQRGLLQTDTPINHGNSGGPLINLKGEVIGINVMVFRGSGFGTDQAEGLGFAIPSNTVETVVRQLIETGTAEMPFLGVSYIDLNPQVSMEYDLSISSGAFIEQVIKGTAAAKADIQPNDIILAINGLQVDDRHPLSQQLLAYSVGESVTLTIARGDQMLELTVVLGKRPNS